jgi:hypothetical protein
MNSIKMKRCFIYLRSRSIAGDGVETARLMAGGD